MFAHASKHDWTLFVARVLLALLFLITGLQILFGGFAGAAGYAASAGVPLASLAIALVIIVKLAGSAGLILGIRVKESAYALAAFTVLTIFFFHLGAGQMVMALKNLAIIGGLLYVAIEGPGSIVWKKKAPVSM